MSGLAFLYSPYWLLLIVAVAGLLSWFLYRSTSDTLPAWARWGLTAFRFCVFFIVGLLILEPSLRSTTKLVNPPVVAILQDNSESLIIQKDSTWMRKEYPQELKKFLKSLEGTKAQTHFFTFGDELLSDQSPDSLTWDKEETDISRALKNIQKLYSNQYLSAVVLLSDGIPTAGMSPLYTTDGFRQPVFTVLLGDTTLQKDIQIAEVLHNELAYLNTESPVKVKLQVNGFPNQRLRVSLSDGTKTIDTKEVIVNGDKASPEVDFSIKPDKVGMAQYNLSVTSLPGEITTRNNFRTIFVNVLETKVKIALFAGFPHPDVGALHEAMDKDDRYEVTDFIHKTASTFYNDPATADLAGFDLIILHNFPFGQADAPWVAKLAELAKNRNLPLMVYVGQFTDLKTLAPLYDYMALAPTNQLQQAEEAQIHFSEEYQSHSTFTFASGWLTMMNNAPPLFRNRSDWRARADSRVFGTATIRNIVLQYPIYALQNHLNRKSMVFVGENFWRLRSHVSVETGDFEGFDAWLFNMIQWLTAKDDKRKFKVYASKPLFGGGDPVIIKGQVYDDSYKPMSGVDVAIKLTKPDKTVESAVLKESGTGSYFLELPNMEPGTYKFTAEGTKGSLKIGTDGGQFSVGTSNAEHLRLQADHGMLKQLSVRTGGKSYGPKELDQLADEIAKMKTLVPETKQKFSRSGFDEFKWIFFLLLGLLTVEWVVRKLFSMV
jgi:hypothetical protein